MAKEKNKISTALLVELFKNLTIEQRTAIKDALELKEDVFEYVREMCEIKRVIANEDH